MPYTVGTHPGQINASNYQQYIPPPGVTPSTDIAALRRRYPGLASLPDSQVANYAAWQDYLTQGPPEQQMNRAMSAWGSLVQQNPELLAAMPSSYAFDPQGNVIHIDPNTQTRDPQTGQVKDRNIFMRHPWLGPALLAGGGVGISALTAPAAAAPAVAAPEGGATLAANLGGAGALGAGGAAPLAAGAGGAGTAAAAAGSGGSIWRTLGRIAGIGAPIVGSLIQSNQISKAAERQQQGTDQAMALQRDLHAQASARYNPYLALGNQAVGNLSGLIGR